MLDRRGGRIYLSRWSLTAVTAMVVLTIVGTDCSAGHGKRRKGMEAKWGPPTEGLAISIDVERQEYSINEPITLNLSLKNVSESSTLLAVRSAWADYKVRVRLEGADEVPKTEFAQRRIEAADVGRRMTMQLEPGQVHTDNLELSKGFNLSRPGAYTVNATREVFKKGKTTEFATVTSNHLVIRIVP